MRKPLLQVIIGSTRPGRIGPVIADWFVGAARRQGAFDVERVDLADVNLPLYDEPGHPRLGNYVHQHTRDWSATVARADAFALVIPEYNHGFNAATKNALDYLNREWADKAVAFVSYGGISAGLRAATALRPIVGALRMVPIVEGVSIAMANAQIADGALKDDAGREAAATVTLTELARVTALLRPTA